MWKRLVWSTSSSCGSFLYNILPPKSYHYIILDNDNGNNVNDNGNNVNVNGNNYNNGINNATENGLNDSIL